MDGLRRSDDAPGGCRSEWAPLESKGVEPSLSDLLLGFVGQWPVCFALFALWLLFHVNLCATGQKESWNRDFNIFLVGELGQAVYAIWGLFFATWSWVGKSDRKHARALLFGASISVVWFSLLCISRLHNFEVRCWTTHLCPSDGFLFLGGGTPNALALQLPLPWPGAWLAYPHGLVISFARLLINPSLFMQQRPFHTPWWRWRELFTALLLDGCWTVALALYARSRHGQAPEAESHVASLGRDARLKTLEATPWRAWLVRGVALAYVFIILTARANMAFYAFLVHPFQELGFSVRHHAAPSLRWEECLVIASAMAVFARRAFCGDFWQQILIYVNELLYLAFQKDFLEYWMSPDEIPTEEDDFSSAVLMDPGVIVTRLATTYGSA